MVLNDLKLLLSGTKRRLEQREIPVLVCPLRSSESVDRL